MDEINDLRKYLTSNKESGEAELRMSPKGDNATVTTMLIMEAIAVIAFGLALSAYVLPLPAWLNLGMSKWMFIAVRMAAFAGILVFIHMGVRGCLAGIHRSRSVIQRAVWRVLILVFVVLTLAALAVLLFFSLVNY